MNTPKTFLKQLAAAACTLSLAGAAQASAVFFDDFQSGLAKWNPIGSAQVVADPLGSGNSVLNFRAGGSGGDVFTAQPYMTGGTYFLSFDILGTCASGNCGGFIGIDQFPGGEIWLIGDNSYAFKDHLVQNNGAWQHFEFAFTANPGGTFRLKVEDFVLSPPAGDVYFDNICVATTAGDTGCSRALPEPGSLALAGLALAGLGLRRRKTA